MTEDENLPKLLSVQAQAVVERAKALGLTWTLRPATVETFESVIYDGDTVPVGVVSLNGTAVAGDRVMCLQIPPGGNYIIGRLSGSSLPFQTTTFRGINSATGDLTLTTTAQAATATTTLTLSSPGRYMITGVFDFDQTVSGGNNLAGGALRIDGVDQAQALFGVTAAGQRATVSQVWEGSLSAGSHTFLLVALKVNNIGTFFARATRTGFTYQIWQ